MFGDKQPTEPEKQLKGGGVLEGVGELVDEDVEIEEVVPLVLGLIEVLVVDVK